MIKNKLEYGGLISGKLLTRIDGNFHHNIQEPPERILWKIVSPENIEKIKDLVI